MFDVLKSGVLIAVIAHGMIGISLVWDKILLRRPATRNLHSYVFWLGAISIFGLLIMPFGFHVPSLKVMGIAFGAGVLELVANWFYYAALQAGEASHTLAVMGGFTPLATVLLALPILHSSLGGASPTGFALMVLGGFVMFFSEKVDVRKILTSVLLASLSFGLVNVLQKVVFDQTNFVSGFVFFSFGTFVGSMAMLIPKSWRRQIFETSEKAEPRSRFWYFVNRFLAGLGSFLLVFAISETHPAIVQAITGVRYVVIFVGAYGLARLRPDLLKEDFTKRAFLGKSTGTLLIAAGLVLVALKGGKVSSTQNPEVRPVESAGLNAAGIGGRQRYRRRGEFVLESLRADAIEAEERSGVSGLTGVRANAGKRRRVEACACGSGPGARDFGNRATCMPAGELPSARGPNGDAKQYGTALRKAKGFARPGANQYLRQSSPDGAGV
jgi:drug/metabolite transporter (DMT)-like permease